MQIKKLKLTNFRKFKNIEIDFEKENLILGNNGVGKTTIAEALYFASFLNSFRTQKKEELIKFNEKIANIEIDYLEKNKMNKININFVENMRKIFLNNKEIKNITDYYGLLNVILIAPSNIGLIDATPNIRRRYLDQYLSQIDKEYFLTLYKYKKYLKIKNNYLKKFKIDEDYYFLLTEQLKSLNDILVKIRLNYLKKIESEMNIITREISNDLELINIEYKQNNKDIISQYEYEMKYKKIAIGIHIDDYSISSNNLSLKKYGSQGQKRLATIAFFLAQNQLIQKTLIKKTVIIFDDVHLELDQRRQDKLFEYLNQENQLIYITTNEEKIKFEKINKIYLKEIE